VRRQAVRYDNIKCRRVYENFKKKLYNSYVGESVSPLFTPKLFAVVKAKCSTSWRKEEKLRNLYERSAGRKRRKRFQVSRKEVVTGNGSWMRIFDEKRLHNENGRKIVIVQEGIGRTYWKE
jgi:hypothetical protein